MAYCAKRFQQGLTYRLVLQEAYEKDAKNPDTLANLITVGIHLGRKSVSRYQE